jgi:hypothetical protein
MSNQNSPVNQTPVERAMDDLASGAPRTGRSVRGIARWAHNTRCGTNNAMFAARIDGDRLLQSTTVQAEFGQSPFAIARGNRAENIARANGYDVTFSLLRENFGYAVNEVVPLDLRHGFSKDIAGLTKRHRETRRALERILRGERDAPNIIDGAVLSANIGGYAAFLEADDIGAKAGPQLHAGEIKGWPVVDGRADDAGKFGEAKRQMGIYRYLTLDLVDQLGGNVEIVSPSGLLITPRNVGMTLTGSVVDLSTATTVAATTLANLPDPASFADVVRPGEGFGVVADQQRTEDERLEHLDTIVDVFGYRYGDSCLASCPLAKFCRSRAAANHEPAVAGTTVMRLLPGVRSLSRAAAIADGAAPTTEEQATGAPAVLQQAAQLYRDKAAHEAVA